VGRKRGAKLRADEQEPDRRRSRSGRAGIKPQSSRDQGSGGVDPAVKKKLGMADLHFHDLRHETVSRLVEAGFSDRQVALISGHKYLLDS